MTAQALAQNIDVISSGFDSGKSNSAAPTPAQMAAGFLSNVDKVAAETQNYLHHVSTTFVYLAQLLGLSLPFNPDPISGKSLIGTPKGGIVSLINAATGATEFYVALTIRAAGYSDPSTDPTNWALINLAAISTYTDPYADAGGTADAITANYPSVIFPVLKDGFRVAVGIATPNATTTPALTVTLNGSVQTGYPIKKRSQTGALTPVAVADLMGTIDFEFDLPNLIWVARNPASDKVTAGQLVVYAGSTPPPGVLQLPNAPTNISRTAYAGLFAAISTSWGAGDGVTTFGLPYIPAGYSILSMVGLGAVGTLTSGQVISHTHQIFYTVSAAGGAVSGSPSVSGSSTLSGPTGGSSNLPAGIAFNIGIRY